MQQDFKFDTNPPIGAPDSQLGFVNQKYKADSNKDENKSLA